MSKRPHGGRHEADGAASFRADAAPAFVGFLSYAARRGSLALAYLACAAVAGGIGYVVAPLVGRPTDAGLWGGVTFALGLIAMGTVVCVTGHALGWRRFDWVECVYAYLT